jgi:penicillin-binding protein 2
VFHLGSTPFHCWRKSGHGTLDMTEALEQSCNVYFCQLGLMCGQEKIFHMAEALGLGSRTGIELETEEAGVLPSDAWKRKTFHDAWRPGDTCNISIGQGMLAVTPLQMAVITSAIANGGKVYRPRLILEPQMKTGRFVRHDFERRGGNEARVTKGDLIKDLRWSAETVKVLKKALYGVVNDSTGTGKRAKIPGVEIAGKTGTAEYGKKEEGKKYTWMVAFAPVETPRYAAAIVIEDGVSGGVTAAPCMRKMMAGLFGVSETGEGQPDTPSATGTTGDLPW